MALSLVALEILLTNCALYSAFSPYQGSKVIRLQYISMFDPPQWENSRSRLPDTRQRFTKVGLKISCGWGFVRCRYLRMRIVSPINSYSYRFSFRPRIFQPLECTLSDSLTELRLIFLLTMCSENEESELWWAINANYRTSTTLRHNHRKLYGCESYLRAMKLK